MVASTAGACPSCGAQRAADVVAVAPTLTLAQMRRLVPAPPPLLSATDWDGVERVAADRAAAGAAADAAGATGTAKLRPVDGAGACAICMEPFGLREQVLLSCSHVFHRSCIDSFERYVGWAKRSCPLCRTTGYQKRRTRQAATDYVLRCATLIQAAYRGHVTRVRFFALRHQLYLPAAGSDSTGSGGGGKVAIDPRRKRAFMAELLGDLSRRLRVAQDERAGKLTALFSELDKSVADSRALVAAAEARLAARLAARSGGAGVSAGASAAAGAPAAPPPTAAPPTPATESAPAGSGGDVAARLLSQVTARLLAAEERGAALEAARVELLSRRPAAAATAAAAAAHADDDDAGAAEPLTAGQWAAVVATVAARGALDGDCAICIMPLADASARKALTLLSCGHVYHGQCMVALESFAAPAGAAPLSRAVAAATAGDDAASVAASSSVDVAGQAVPPAGCRCPVCRAAYVRAALLGVGGPTPLAGRGGGRRAGGAGGAGVGGR